MLDPSLSFRSTRRVHVVLSSGALVKGEQFDEFNEWGSGQYELLLTVRPDRSTKTIGCSAVEARIVPCPIPSVRFHPPPARRTLVRTPRQRKQFDDCHESGSGHY